MNKRVLSHEKYTLLCKEARRFSDGERLILFYTGVIAAILSIVATLTLCSCGGSEEVDLNLVTNYEFNSINCNTMESNKVELDELLGPRGVLLVFFSGTCPYCKYEALYLQELYNKYKSLGVNFVNIVISGEFNDCSDHAVAIAACKYRGDYGFTFVSATDPGRASTKGLVRAVPSNVIVDEDRRLFGRIEGNHPTELGQVLDELVKR